MTEYYWRDLHDRDNSWQGLELVLRHQSVQGRGLEMLSGHCGRMVLCLNKEPLYWGTMLKDHSGAWLVFNADHSGSGSLLPPVTSADVERMNNRQDATRIREWCRYFARQLASASEGLLPPSRWILRPMTAEQRHAPRICKEAEPGASWCFCSPESAGNLGFDWRLEGRDFPDLLNPEKITLVDWWWSESPLLATRAVKPNSGRVKWWRKKSRERALPPVLVWYIGGFGAYLIIDGHSRLQAAVEEKIPPQFLVLSGLMEREFSPDPQAAARTLRGLEQQLSTNRRCSIQGVNQTLINLYDTRYLYSATYSRATLGNEDAWADGVLSYLNKHQLTDKWGAIFGRISEQ